jgi:hypothetical protein
LSAIRARSDVICAVVKLFVDLYERV